MALTLPASPKSPLSTGSDAFHLSTPIQAKFFLQRFPQTILVKISDTSMLSNLVYAFCPFTWPLSMSNIKDLFEIFFFCVVTSLFDSFPLLSFFSASIVDFSPLNSSLSV